MYVCICPVLYAGAILLVLSLTLCTARRCKLAGARRVRNPRHWFSFKLGESGVGGVAMAALVGHA